MADDNKRTIGKHSGGKPSLYRRRQRSLPTILPLTASTLLFHSPLSTSTSHALSGETDGLKDNNASSEFANNVTINSIKIITPFSIINMMTLMA